jgi:FkbH-like protein
MVNDPRSVAFTLRLADRFGDHGLVAVLLAAGEGDNLRVDTWLMSCRVISRTAEEFVFRALVTRARALGYRTIVGDYVPTRKNAQVAELYPRLGFRVDGAPPDEPEGRRFVVDLAEVDLPVTHVHASDVDGRA